MTHLWSQLYQEILESTFKLSIKINTHFHDPKLNKYSFSKVPYESNVDRIIISLLDCLKQYQREYQSALACLLDKPNGTQIIEQAEKHRRQNQEISILIYLFKVTEHDLIKHYLKMRQLILRSYPTAYTVDNIILLIEDWATLIDRMLPHNSYTKKNVSEVFDFMKAVSEYQGYQDYSLPATVIGMLSMIVFRKYRQQAGKERHAEEAPYLNPQQPIEGRKTKYDYSYRLKQEPQKWSIE